MTDLAPPGCRACSSGRPFEQLEHASGAGHPYAARRDRRRGRCGIGVAAADPSITAKRAEAESVLAQIEEIDSRLSHAIEAYNLANVKLDKIGEAADERASPEDRARQLKNGQRHLAERLVALYVGGSDSRRARGPARRQSVDDLLNRLDAVDRAPPRTCARARRGEEPASRCRSARVRLNQARAAQKRVVADRAVQRQSIEGQLAERQRLLSSIQDQIASMEAEGDAGRRPPRR